MAEATPSGRTRQHGAYATQAELSALLRIGQVAGSAVDPREAAAEILDLFGSIVPYAAASLSTWNPFTDRHETIANSGYPEHVIAHLDSWFVQHDEVYRLMRTVDPRPLRWRDMPFDYRRLHSAREVFIPVGFDEGVTTCLYTLDGRYTGSFHVSTDVRCHPSDAAMQALLVLQSTLAGLVDALRVPNWRVASEGPVECAAVVTLGAEVVPLPSHVPGPHLADGSPLVQTTARLLACEPSVSRYLWQDESGQWHRVLVERIAEGAVIAVTPTELPLRLTPREVDVLTLLAEGHSNPEIARILVTSTKTIAKHVEHVLHKLRCTSRSAAAARAIGDGLLRRPLPALAPALRR